MSNDGTGPVEFPNFKPLLHVRRFYSRKKHKHLFLMTQQMWNQSVVCSQCQVWTISLRQCCRIFIELHFLQHVADNGDHWLHVQPATLLSQNHFEDFELPMQVENGECRDSFMVCSRAKRFGYCGICYRDRRENIERIFHRTSGNIWCSYNPRLETLTNVPNCVI